MKKTLIIIVCIIFLFISIFSIKDFIDNQTNNVSKQSIQLPTIIIDAGHGGVDVGAIGIDGNFEKDINLAISLNLYDYLMVSGINTKMIRAGDYEFYQAGEERTKSDLYNRLDYVNSFDNSILVSIHQNHFENENEWGTQVWYSPNDNESKTIADNVLNAIKTNLQPDNNRENKESTSAYYILYKATKPSIMVECGFISNQEENKKLQDENYQKKMAYSILIGLSEGI